MRLSMAFCMAFEKETKDTYAESKASTGTYAASAKRTASTGVNVWNTLPWSWPRTVATRCWRLSHAPAWAEWNGWEHLLESTGHCETWNLWIRNKAVYLSILQFHPSWLTSVWSLCLTSPDFTSLVCHPKDSKHVLKSHLEYRCLMICT